MSIFARFWRYRMQVYSFFSKIFALQQNQSKRIRNLSFTIIYSHNLASDVNKSDQLCTTLIRLYKQNLLKILREHNEKPTERQRLSCYRSRFSNKTWINNTHSTYTSLHFVNIRHLHSFDRWGTVDDSSDYSNFLHELPRYPTKPFIVMALLFFQLSKYTR